MEDKKLYLVSLGPGDYEQLTIKTIRSIMDSETLFLPIRDGKSRAGVIINSLKENLTMFNFIENKFPEIKFIESPMKPHYDQWETEVKQIVEEFETKNIIAYGTLGDIGIYSRSYYLLEVIKNKYKDIYKNIIITPGISSFSYASAKAQKPLCTKDINLSIVTYNSNKTTRVYMKPKLSLKEDYPARKNLIYFENVGTNEEKIERYTGKEIKEYMSLLIDFEE